MSNDTFDVIVIGAGENGLVLGTYLGKAGLKVLVYTVDHPQDMKMLKSWDVDGIFTNVPDIAREVLA